MKCNGLFLGIVLSACAAEKSHTELCDDAALVLLHNQQDVSSDFVDNCRQSLGVLKNKGGDSYISARNCLGNAQSADDLTCAVFVSRTPEMLCDRLAKTLWRNNQKLNENGFSTCTDMLNRYKTKGDDRFMKAITCIEGAKTVEDLDCVLGLQDGE